MRGAQHYARHVFHFWGCPRAHALRMAAHAARDGPGRVLPSISFLLTSRTEWTRQPHERSLASYRGRIDASGLAKRRRRLGQCRFLGGTPSLERIKVLMVIRASLVPRAAGNIKQSIMPLDAMHFSISRERCETGPLARNAIERPNMTRRPILESTGSPSRLASDWPPEVYVQAARRVAQKFPFANGRSGALISKPKRKNCES
jgi:hypothetical protein